MTQIRTRWHKVAPAIEAGQLFLTAIEGSHVTKYHNYQINLKKAIAQVDDLSDLPKFVVEPELIDMARKGDYEASLLDMKRAGLLKLPFVQMMVEIPNHQGEASFILLQDISQFDKPAVPDFEGFDFRGWVFHLLKDEAGEYVVFAPSIVLVSVEERDGKPYLKISGHSTTLLPNDTRTNELVRQTYQKDAGTIYHGILAAVLLMSTRGVAREAVDPVKINKKRLAGGHRPIPDHTYLYIGRVYNSAKGEGSSEYVPGRTIRPHWRRAHLARWRTGPRKADERGWGQKFVEARIVALAADAEEASVKQPTYIVKVPKSEKN